MSDYNIQKESTLQVERGRLSSSGVKRGRLSSLGVKRGRLSSLGERSPNHSVAVASMSMMQLRRQLSDVESPKEPTKRSTPKHCHESQYDDVFEPAPPPQQPAAAAPVDQGRYYCNDDDAVFEMPLQRQNQQHHSAAMAAGPAPVPPPQQPAAAAPVDQVEAAMGYMNLGARPRERPVRSRANQGAAEKSYHPCTYDHCKKSFTRPYSRQQLECHLGITHQCQKCLKEYKKRYLKEHMKKCNGMM